MKLVAGNIRISGSVGRNGMNFRNDVLAIQQLLNNHLPIPLRPNPRGKKLMPLSF
jgi:hypothetical protein